MTYSLRIFNGDLVKGQSNNLDLVWGSDKVVQDLMCWIREPYGTDPVNPDLGTLIQNGEDKTTFSVNRNFQGNYSNYENLVVSEIQRVISDYQQRQLSKAKLEMSLYGDIVTFESDELINNFKVSYTKSYDTMYILINLYAGNNEYSFSIPVQDSSILKGF
jgi:hypothetical protein